MGVSKTGFLSLIAGIILMLVVWYFAFFKGDVAASVIALVVAAVIAGIFWIGLALFVIGLLILVL